MRLSRFRLSLAALAALMMLAIVGTVAAMGALGAKPAVANRWHHSSSPAVSVSSLSEATAEARIKPGLVWKTLVLKELFAGGKFTAIDVGDPGDSVGDYVIFRDKIADAGTNEIIGTIDVMCVTGYADMCSGTFRLAGRGQIKIDGITPLGVDPDHFPVLGGTGNFVDIGGVDKISFPSDEYALHTLTLTH
jgi:hypothetical protein